MNRLLRVSKIVIPVWLTLLFVADVVAAFYPFPLWRNRLADAFDIVDVILLLVMVITYLSLFIVRFRSKRKAGQIELRFNNSSDAFSIVAAYVMLAIGTAMITDYLLEPRNYSFVLITVFLFLTLNNYTSCYQCGMCKEGIVITGYFYPWERVAAYAMLNDTVYLLIRRRKEGDPRLLERPIVSYAGEDLAGYLECRGIRRQPQPEGSYDNHKSDGV